MGTSKAARKIKQDECIMGTNNSSIASKRSVERLYHDEPHFFRYFVPKPQRRSPLINRGYWLRMHAIEHVVHQFLDEPSEKGKVIMNLGCGYDPIAFQWLSKAPEACRDVKFIDVDYPDLIAKKSDIISSTPHFQQYLHDMERIPASSGILLRSQRYVALGCDMTDVAELDRFWQMEINASECLVLCIAEVSVTYMDTISANRLIRWASDKQMRFCLLEQYFPAGPNHPFARKMIEHFSNLHTPLRSVHAYPMLKDQEQRFRESGWDCVAVESLWEVWNNNSSISPNMRASLNDVEPFDEWEELVLFASHYFLLLASPHLEHQSDSAIRSFQSLAHPSMDSFCEAKAYETCNIHVAAQQSPVEWRGKRRFGTLFQVSGTVLGHHGGLGAQRRSSTTDFYSVDDNVSPEIFERMDAMKSDLSRFSARMCHTVTSCNQGCLLVGGRMSPDHPLKDCWLLDGGIWKQSDDLPTPLYRHCAVRVDLHVGNDSSSGVLVFGGKTSASQTMNKWLLWQFQVGWTEISADGKLIEPRFGASIASTGPANGILLGGMSSEGIILSDLWRWNVVNGTDGLTLQLKKCRASLLGRGDHNDSDMDSTSKPGVSSIHEARRMISRLGACLVSSAVGLLLIGGVSNSLEGHTDIIKLSQYNDGGETDWLLTPVDRREGDDHALLVGHSVLARKEAVYILGGGAVCFSFGTHWNMRPSTVCSKQPGRRAVLRPLYCSANPPADSTGSQSTAYQNPPLARVKSSVVRTVCVKSPEDFMNVIENGQPAIMRGLNIGACVKEWTLEGLKDRIGSDREVVVHEASDPHMDFQTKNFVYVKKSFGNFIEQIGVGSKQYLRSLAAEAPFKTPANITRDFPQLSDDFKIPNELEVVKHNIHSSVLRVSGPVQMWLHYDVLDNVLCQIQGNKRLILYPPSDVTQLAIPPGASSSSIDPFAEDLTGRSLTPHAVLLAPGDILYLPPLWLHAASPMTTTSISVNVFFNNMTIEDEAKGRDVYANRDYHVYEQGRKDVKRLAKTFNRLPKGMATFYLERLAEELKDLARRDRAT